MKIRIEKKEIKKYLVFAGMGLLFIGCMYLIVAPSKSEKEKEAKANGFNTDVPDPEKTAIIEDKQIAYQQEKMEQKQAEKMKSLEDFDHLFDTPEEEHLQEDLPEQIGTYKTNVPVSSNSIGQSVSTYQDINRSLDTYYQTPRQTATENRELLQKIDELETKLSEQKSVDSKLDEQLYLMEKSYEMAAKYLPQTTSGPTDIQQAVETDVPEVPAQDYSNRKAQAAPIRHKKENVISSLEQPLTQEEFIKRYSQPRNHGFNSLDESASGDTRNTIHAIIQGDQTVKDGQSVRLRVTEDFLIGRTLIPVHTMLTGTVKLTGERLHIAITHVEKEGTILPVEMSVYDSDGQAGIYIPGSMELDALKEIGANMGSGLNSSINISQQSAGEQLLTDMGRSLITGSSQYINKKIREVKVSLKAGHKVLLLPAEKL